MFEVAEYIGIIAFTMSGFFVAVRSRLDLLGVLISVFLTAFGGGIIRDIIVDKTPYTFTHAVPGFMVLGMMILMIILKFHKRESIENKPLFIISDSIGLVSFSITGALVAMQHELNLTGVLALSFVTAVGGGITRDVIINEVPFVFKTGFYGTIALLVAIVLYGLDQFGILNIYTTTLLFAAGVVLRIVAYQNKWSIPLR
ncbi:TRIC cation channel family protein [Sulfurovum sp. zt1-1]|uniref:TRIC cation channel family protein n=1 Tax=Sulfurovum zhangzhouensis TaxID=3019067 RepID=A0ABT7QYI8_9BACT|nr:TRIC cation channel family protein [Sulfurovum zhangzhouensis]MDM5271892.1 TRIC cation channel family protein [Sulfurovum zhangzhouensis]